jgi:hypothetical protein
MSPHSKTREPLQVTMPQSELRKEGAQYLSHTTLSGKLSSSIESKLLLLSMALRSLRSATSHWGKQGRVLHLNTPTVEALVARFDVVTQLALPSDISVILNRIDGMITDVLSDMGQCSDLASMVWHMNRVAFDNKKEGERLAALKIEEGTTNLLYDRLLICWRTIPTLPPKDKQEVKQKKKDAIAKKIESQLSDALSAVEGKGIVKLEVYDEDQPTDSFGNVQRVRSIR